MSRQPAWLPRPVPIRLDNGLDVILHHHPGLTRSAAALRIHGGSHDAPRAFPGLAHFLEHLVFLGSAHFPAGQGLIPFVQAQAGEVNASTRERHTDFFFELPSHGLDAGLARLGDMIAAPLLTLDSQQREREVLHAEFLAWSRTAGLCAMPLAASLPPAHPASRFHAGNRYSLPIRQPAFQAALHEHHRQHYLRGRKTLVIAGPRPLDELQWLARRHGERFPAITALPQPTPVPALPLRRGHAPVPSDSDMSLAFVLDRLPRGAKQALEFLGFYLTEDSPGGWQGHLRRAGMVERLDLALTHLEPQQALLKLDLALCGAGHQRDVIDLLFDWLAFFARIRDLQPLHDQYRRVQQLRLETLSPLVLARHWLDPDSHSPTGQANALQAMPAVLAQLRREQFLHLRGAQEYPSGRVAHWHLPPPNPFLLDDEPEVGPRARTPSPASLPLQRGPERAHPNGQGALFLRWRSETPAREQGQLLRMLQAHLAPLNARARQAGLEVRFTRRGTDWEVAFIGLVRFIPRVLQAFLQQLRLPSVPQCHTPPARNAGRMLIQCMLERLENGLEPTSVPLPADELESAWAACWKSAVWDGLSFGLDDPLHDQVIALLAAMPGLPATRPITPLCLSAERRWHAFESRDPQHGLLLFCAQPDHAPATEAAWQVLAQLIQAPFYQRMRTELQLGYGVFSGYRRINGRAGLLFGIQSPTSAPSQILELTEAFLDACRERLDGFSSAQIRQRSAEVSERFDDPRRAAEQQWHACKSGQELGIQGLRAALSNLTRGDLISALEALRHARGGWSCMATEPTPDCTWR